MHIIPYCKTNKSLDLSFFKIHKNQLYFYRSDLYNSSVLVLPLFLIIPGDKNGNQLENFGEKD